MYKWIEIDLDAIKNNFLQVRQYINAQTKILGVVKADAYGHGLVEVSKELERQGIDYLGVTEIAEGIKLREAGVKTPILVFGPFLPEDAGSFQQYQLTATLSSLSMVEKLIDLGLSLTVHLKIETGFGRTGLKYAELDRLVELLNNNENINIEGIYSHLATGMWANPSFAKQQFSVFLQAVEFLEDKGLMIPLKHICNSAALVKFPEMHLDMVRAGTILYGQEAAGREDFKGHLQNAWSLKGQVTYINELPKGHSIGYERTHILKAPSKTAIVPIGYSHGFSVEPVPKPKGVLDLIKVVGKIILRFFDHPKVKVYAQIRGKSVPVLGKVGMQMTVFDVTSIPDLKIGEIVQLPGRRTNISPLLPKVYLKDKKPVSVSKIDEKYEQIGNIFSLQD
ncbi:MAG: alanine racemase [Clostridia bacterium]|nr:alanine racemase [Clostridia bacterium]